MVWDFGQAFNSVILAMVDNPFFLVFLLVGLVMIPLSFFGAYQMYTWFNHWSKLRAGWIRVRKKLSNGRWVEFWARPVGRKIKIKGEEGLDFEVPVRIEKDYMGYESDLNVGIPKVIENPKPDQLRELVVSKPVIKKVAKKDDIEFTSEGWRVKNG